MEELLLANEYSSGLYCVMETKMHATEAFVQ